MAAGLYLWFYVTFVSWYQLPRGGSLLASALETWPLFGLELWGNLLSPFWVRPCLYILCLAGLTGFFWSLWPRATLESTLPGLATLALLKLALLAADLRLLSPEHAAHLVLTWFFLLGRPRLACLRLALLLMALAAALQDGRWFLWVAFLSLLWPRTAPLYLAIQFALWQLRGLTALISHATFDDSGCLLVLGGLILLPPDREKLSLAGAALPGLLFLAVAPFASFVESRPNGPTHVRYTLEQGSQRCVIQATLPQDRSEPRLEAQFFSGGVAVRHVQRLSHPVTFEGRLVFSPERFRLASPATRADPAFHEDYARRAGARVELFHDP